jgi:phosphoadenosine phosphosulfate reductase
MLIEQTLFGTRDKAADAIERIRLFEPEDRPYYLAFSGGKDSQCIYHLAIESGVNFEAHYNLTTVDPPELIQFIKRNYPEVSIDRPEYSMWELIIKNRCLPTRIARHCCKYLKEKQTPNGSTVLMGVRRGESSNRRNRQVVERCRDDNTITWVSPIVDWSESDVWEFIHSRKLKYCELYDQGFKRLGCIMCPQKREKKMRRDAERWPKYYRAYERAAGRLMELQKANGKEFTFKNATEMMDFWISGEGIKEEDNEPCFRFD